MLRFALAAALLALSAAPASAQTRPDIAGEWTGKYICGQGITALRLHITQRTGDEIEAVFNFGPLPENPTVPKGAYEMRGLFNPASRHLQLEGVKWIEAPNGYIMVGLDGKMSASGEKIAGRVPDLFGCSHFEIYRSAPLVG